MAAGLGGKPDAARRFRSRRGNAGRRAPVACRPNAPPAKQQALRAGIDQGPVPVRVRVPVPEQAPVPVLVPMPVPGPGSRGRPGAAGRPPVGTWYCRRAAATCRPAAPRADWPAASRDERLRAGAGAGASAAARPRGRPRAAGGPPVEARYCRETRGNCPPLRCSSRRLAGAHRDDRPKAGAGADASAAARPRGRSGAASRRPVETRYCRRAATVCRPIDPRADWHALLAMIDRGPVLVSGPMPLPRAGATRAAPSGRPVSGRDSVLPRDVRLLPAASLLPARSGRRSPRKVVDDPCDGDRGSGPPPPIGSRDGDRGPRKCGQGVRRRERGAGRIGAARRSGRGPGAVSRGPSVGGGQPGASGSDRSTAIAGWCRDAGGRRGLEARAWVLR